MPNDDYEMRWYDLTRERIGIVLNLDYRLNESTDLYLRTLYNQYTDDEVRNKFEFREMDEEVVSVSGTSVAYRRGEVDAEVRQREEVRNIQTYALGGETFTGPWQFNYELSYAFAEEDDSNNHDVNFRSSPEQRDSDIGSITFDYSNPEKPVISGNALAFLYDPSNYTMDAFEREFTDNQDTEWTGKIDVARDSLIGDIPVVWKGGLKLRDREKVRDQNLKIYEADDILPHLERFKGKGENLWKALYVTRGDIIIYIDADIKNIHHRFAYGLLGPLLLSDQIRFSKAFYDRPISVGENKWRPTGGGRVTELVTRPLFSLFMPDLTQFVQPLSGEYAGYRHIFEAIPFHIGYGVETGMLIDIHEKWGLNVMAQVDLDRRVHKNQDTKALGRMSFVIIKTFLKRIQKLKRVDVNQRLFDEMIQYHLVHGKLQPDVHILEEHERPPIIQITEYQEKFAIHQL